MLGTFGGVDGPLLLFPGLGKKSSIGVGQSCLLPTTLPVSTRDNKHADKGALRRMGGKALPVPDRGLSRIQPRRMCTAAPRGFKQGRLCSRKQHIVASTACSKCNRSVCKSILHRHSVAV